MNKRQVLVKRAAKNLARNEDFETLIAYMLIETETRGSLTGEALTVDVNRKAMMRDGITAILDEVETQNAIEDQAIGDDDDYEEA